MLLQRFLEDGARRAAEAVALIEPSRQTTYGDLDALANRMANLLRASGVRRGDRVVLAIDNCAELVAGYFGTMKAGAVAVPLPAGPRSDRLSRAVEDCSPSAAIVDTAIARDIIAGHPLSSLRAVFVASPHRVQPPAGNMHWLPEAFEGIPDTPCGVRGIDQDLAAIIYTSGSTGEPRGVMLTHRNVVSNARSIVEYLQLTSADRAMCVLPFYYVYGLSVLHTHIAVGGSVVIENRFAFPNVVLEGMQRHRVTGFAGVPSTFALLLHRSSVSEMSFPALRYATQAGGGMPVARIQEWLERGFKVPFYVMYGATEASARLTYLEPSMLEAKLGSIGRAIPNVEILVVKEDGTRAAPGEVGELVARGSNISRGYWNNPAETAEKFGPLGYKTGDLGRMDEDGYLFLVGRRHDMIKVGAHRVGAKEIEDILHEHEAVHEVAVVASSDDLLGEVPVAFVSLKAPLPSAGDLLRAFCSSRLPPHKVPRQIVLRRELPKIGGIGKIDKRLLRDLAESLPHPSGAM